MGRASEFPNTLSSSKAPGKHGSTISQCTGGRRSLAEGRTARRQKRLCRGNAQAYIRCLRRVGERPDRDKIHSGFRISTNVFERDPARNLEWNAAFQTRA